jgi:CRISPR-associated endonuclease Cas1
MNTATSPQEASVQWTYHHDSTDPAVLIADGYGLAITVNRGHLTIADGIGKTRRERRIPRAQRQIRRIVVLGHTGHITLDAVRFCADTGIALAQIDTDGQILLTAGSPAKDDARLRRAQAAAPNAPVGLEITRALLRAKIDGQAAVLEEVLEQSSAASLLASFADRLGDAKTLPGCRDLEAQASNLYFGAWAGTVQCRFATRDAAKVPDHWGVFAARRSPVGPGKTAGSAADPINALLNYGYALAELECLLAIQAVALDPGLGIVHTDHRNRDSLALDLLEPLRPLVERHVLRMLQRKHFTTADLFETRQGICRLLPPLTHQLVEKMPGYAAAVAPLAEQVAHAVADTSPGKIHLTTPLTRKHHAGVQRPGPRSANRRPTREKLGRNSCEVCGVDLYGSARKLCPTCWPVRRKELMRQLGVARRGPARPGKPSTVQLSGGITFEEYRTQVLPGLVSIPLPVIERATGLSNSSCSLIRRGLQVPNPRHWLNLAELSRSAAAIS